MKYLNSVLLLQGIIDWDEVWHNVWTFIYSVLIWFDGIIFNLINVCYQIFYALSRVRIFDESVFNGIFSRFYILIGICTLFFLAYSLLKVIVNPDNMTKGNYAPGKLISKILISIILLSLVPTIFNKSYQIQNVIMDNDIIGKVIFDNDTNYVNDSENNMVRTGGRTIAMTFWSAFFYSADGNDCTPAVESDWPAALNHLSESANNYSGSILNRLGNLDEVRAAVNSCSNDDYISLAEARNLYVAADNLGFRFFTNFATNAAEDDGVAGKIDYHPFISAICAGFCVYVIVCFLFDVAIRAVKLAILQLIAPVPILMNIMPGKEGALKKWISLSIGTFAGVFIRIFLVYMIVFLTTQINNLWSGFADSMNLSGLVRAFAKVFLLMGVIAFSKQAPKMITDIIGIKGEDMKLGGLRDKLREGGGMAAAGLAAGGLTSAARGISNTVNGYKAAETRGERFKALAGGVASTIGGTVSGGVRGGINARNAKTFRDVAEASSKAANTVSENRLRRKNYRDEHGGILGAAKENVRDIGRSFMNWATGSTTANLQDARNRLNKPTEAFGAVADTIKKDMNDNANSYVVDSYTMRPDGTMVRSGKRLLSHLKSEMEQANNEAENFNMEQYMRDTNSTRAEAEAHHKELLAIQHRKQREYQKAFNEALANQIAFERGDAARAVKFESDNIRLDSSGIVTGTGAVAHVASIDVKIEAANQMLQRNRSEIIQIAQKMRDDDKIDFTQDDLDKITNALAHPEQLNDKKMKDTLNKIVKEYDKEIYKRRVEEEKKDKK